MSQITLYKLHWLANLAFIIFGAQSALCQNSGSDSPVSSYFGLDGGVTYSKFGSAPNFFFIYVYPYDPQSGIAKNMYFANPGYGYGYQLGISAELPFSAMNALRLGLHYNKLSTGSTDIRINASPDITQNSLSASFQSTYKSVWAFISSEALFRQSVFSKSFYVLLGAEFSYLISDRLDATQKIASADTGSQYISSATHTLTGKREFNVVDQTSSNYYNSYQLYAKFGIGAFIPLVGDFFLSPELQLSYPLNNFFTSAAQEIYNNANSAAPRFWHIDFTLSILYAIAGRSQSAPEQSTPHTLERAVVKEQKFEKEKTAFMISGKVKNCKTLAPIIADLQVTNLDSNKTILNTQTSILGSFSIPISEPGQYSVTASARGYNFISALYDLSDSSLGKRVVIHEIHLCPEGNNIPLLVFFDYDKAELKPSSFVELDRATRLMKETPEMKVLIVAYTDDRGTDQYNDELSLRRAKAVRNFLIAKKIDPTRILAKGDGKRDPIASNDTEEGRAENRRVEFVIVKP